MRIPLLTILILATKILFCQTADITAYNPLTIKIDTLTGKASAPLPFDRPFILQYDLAKGDKIDTVYIYKVELTGNRRQPILDDSNMLTPLNPALLESFYVSGNSLFIRIKYLPPKTLIDIAVLKKLRAHEIDPLLVINEMIADGFTLEERVAASVEYRKFIHSTRSTQYPVAERLFDKWGWEDYLTIFWAPNQPYYQQLYQFNYSLGMPGLQLPDFAATATTFKDLKLASPELPVLYYARNENFLTDVAEGIINLPKIAEASPPTKTRAFETRMENLQQSVQFLNNLIIQIESAELTNSTYRVTSFRNDVIALRNILLRNKDHIETNFKAIAKALNNRKTRLFKDLWIMSGTDFVDLATRSKFLLVPDIGIANMFIGGQQRTYYFPRPFIGTNIYFRPVDKELLEKSIPYKDWKRRISLQIGLTFGKFDATEFDNLFNDFSLLVGPSFRLNQSFRLSTGTVLYKANRKNPLFTDKRVALSGFLAFSFDVDILSNAGAARARVLK